MGVTSYNPKQRNNVAVMVCCDASEIPKAAHLSYEELLLPTAPAAAPGFAHFGRSKVIYPQRGLWGCYKI